MDQESASLGLFQEFRTLLLRTPTLSHDYYLEFSINSAKESDWAVVEAWRNPEVRRLIALTSPSLYREIKLLALVNKEISKKQYESIIDSITKYVIRASMRPTPFGALAAFTSVSIGEETSLVLNNESAFKIVAQPNCEFTSQVVAEWVRKKNDLSEMLVYWNNTIYEKGQRWYRPAHFTGFNRTYSLKRTRALEVIKRLTRSPIKMSQIEDALVRNNRASSATVRSFLIKLIEQGFLMIKSVSDVLCLDPTKVLIDKSYLSDDVLRQSLEQIRTEIESFNRESAADQLDTAELLSSLGQELGVTAPVFRLDTQVRLSTSSQISSRDVPPILAAVEALAYLNSPNLDEELNAYAEKFVDKFGLQEVPLLHLMDEDLGLGAPPGYTRPPARRHWPTGPAANVLTKAVEEYLLELAGTALHTGIGEVTISLQRLQNLVLDAAVALPASADVFVRLRWATAGDQGKEHLEYLVTAVGAVAPAGRAIGRFGHIDAGLREVLEAIVSFDEMLADQADELLAEVVYSQESAGLSNLTSRSDLIRHQLLFAVPNQRNNERGRLVMGPEEVLVGVSAGRFYLRHRPTGKRLRVRTLHAVNASLAPNAVRFALEVSRDGQPGRLVWHWGAAAALPRTPRVRMGDVVLSPARWRVPEHVLNREMLDQEFDTWCAQWDVPQYVCVGDFDTKLVLDRLHPIHRRVLLRELKSTPPFLEEAWELPGQGALRGAEGQRHSVELVIPVSCPTRAARAPLPLPRLEEEQSDMPRTLLPGGQCLYLKVYGPVAEQDAALIQLADELAQRFSNLDWFFVRFQDPEHHLRLRVFGPLQVLWQHLLPSLTERLTELHQRHIVTSFTLETYTREFERYGGAEALAVIEQLFAVDSAMVLRVRNSTEHLEELALLALCSVTVDSLARHFAIDIESRFQLYRSIHLSHSVNSNVVHEWSGIFTRVRRLTIQQFSNNTVFHEYNDGVDDIVKRLKSLAADGKMTRPLFDIVPSLLHMHCNRMGLDLRQERQLFFILMKLFSGFRHHLPEGVQLSTLL